MKASRTLLSLSQQKVVPGAGADAAVLGYLLSWLAGQTRLWSDLCAEIIDVYEIDLLRGVDKSDMVAVCRRAIQS